MNSITEGLTAWGVPDKNVHYEAFGPATVKKTTPPPTPAETSMLSKLKVTFGRQGKTARWDPAISSLLDFAEANGVKIDAGCRAGNCGTCLVAIKSGTRGLSGPHRRQRRTRLVPDLHLQTQNRPCD